MGFSRRRKAKNLEAQLLACGDAITRESSGAPKRAGTVAEDLGLGGQPVLVVLTDPAIYWSLLIEPESVMQMRYDRISDVEQEEGHIRLTERDPEYAASLDDPSNPYGETDFDFQLRSQDSSFKFSGLLNRALLRYSPVFAEKRGQLQRFKARQGTPVWSWSKCPYCETRLSSKVEGAVVCSACHRCFCDADLAPI